MFIILAQDITNEIYLLAQFRPLLNKFDCNAGHGNQSEGLKLRCYSDSGRKQLETKASLPSRSVVWSDSSIVEKLNWRDNSSIVLSSAHGSNNRCLAWVPRQQGKWDHWAIPCWVDTSKKGCSARNGMDQVELEMVRSKQCVRNF